MRPALPGRRAVLAAAVAALGSLGARAADARPLRILVPLAPGGAADATVRLIGDGLSKTLQRPLVVDNRPGGGTVTGTLALANAEPDGDTIGFVVSAHAINQAMRHQMPYDALADFEPVCLCGNSVLALVAAPELPAANVAELLRLAARDRAGFQYASLGVGSASHLAGELFNLRAGVEIQHVPFNGSPQVYRALMGRQILLAFVTMDSALPHIRSGRLKVLGVTDARRSAVFPSYPAIAETLPGYEVNGFFGFMAPARTAPAVVGRLYEEIARVLRSPAVAGRMAELGAVVHVGSPAQFTAFLQQEIARYAALARRTGIKVE